MRARSCLVILLAGALVCRGTTYYVSETGDDGTGAGTSESPWLTVSNGVAHAAAAGDVVLVAAGSYVLTDQLVITNAICLRGAPQTNAILQGLYPDVTNRAIYLGHAGATVEQFTICGFGMPDIALADYGAGGGVYIQNGTLRACIVSNNIGATGSGAFGGGGVYLGVGLVSNCVIRGNTCRCLSTSGYAGGGGLYAATGSAMVWNSLIADKSATQITGSAQGGGVFMHPGSVLAHCTVSNNISYNDGGGINIRSGVISNCIVENNTVMNDRYGGGIFCTGAGTNIIHGTLVRENRTTSIFGGIGSGGSGFVGVFDSEISGNKSGSLGGGVGLNGPSLLITNCVISNNIARGGGGICLGQYAHAGATAAWCRIGNNICSNANGAGCDLGYGFLLDHCVIQNNIITNAAGYGRKGGGIYVRSHGAGTIRNCLIADHTSPDIYDGGGIWIEPGATTRVEACSIAGNYGSRWGGGLGLYGDGSDVFINCVIASNRCNVAADANIYMTTAARSNAFEYCCSEKLTNAARGNLTAGPLFEGAAASDWRLRPESPGINAGTNAPWMAEAGGLDLDGRRRLDCFHRQADMGCYENTPRGMMFEIR